VSQRLLAQTSATLVFPTYKSTTRVDIALLASALFLQRFGLPFFHTRLTFDFVFAALIFFHQFASGRLFIQYDRLLWFLVVVLTATFSLFLNFESRMLTSYGLFVLVYFLFALSRPSNPEQYKGTLQGFQSLVFIISCLAIAQFAAQLVVDGRKLIMFYGVVPDFLLEPMAYGREVGPVTSGSSLIKSNGMFLNETSDMSQMAAFGILIEVLEFRRPRYLIVLTLGLLLAYSGVGISIVLLCLPLAGLVNRRAQLPAMLISLFAFGLFATGIIQLSAFTSRVGEWEDPHASAFGRFVSPFWMAADYFDTASLPQLLWGNGPGGIGFIPSNGTLTYSVQVNSWFNFMYFYGLICAFVFICFWGYCFRRSRCPKPLIAALIYRWLFTGGYFLDTPVLIIMVVLCTLNAPEPRRGRMNGPGQDRSPLGAGLAAG
jgi:hypothetical protein